MRTLNTDEIKAVSGGYDLTTNVNGSLGVMNDGFGNNPFGNSGHVGVTQFGQGGINNPNGRRRGASIRKETAGEKAKRMCDEQGLSDEATVSFQHGTGATAGFGGFGANTSQSITVTEKCGETRNN